MTTDLSAEPPRRRRVPLVLSAIVVLVAAATVALVTLRRDDPSAPAGLSGSASSADSTALSCPDRFAGAAADSQDLTDERAWVPEKPHGVDTGGRLAPKTAPASVIVCAYGGGGRPRQPASAVLGGDLGVVTADLSRPDPAGASRKMCLTYLATTDFDNFLLGLRFADGGTEWVSVLGDHCAGSSNGVDTSGRNWRADAQAAYRLGYWNTDPAATAGCLAPSDGYPKDRVVVPPGANAVQICIGQRDDRRWRAYVYNDGMSELRNEINESRLFVAAAGCVVPPDGSGVVVTFSYPDRPKVVVAVTKRCANGVAAGQGPSIDDVLFDIEFFYVDRL